MVHAHSLVLEQISDRRANLLTHCKVKRAEILSEGTAYRTLRGLFNSESGTSWHERCQNVASQRIKTSIAGGIDVGHIPRQFLARTDSFFGSPDHLTVFSTFLRRQVGECAIGAASVVVEPPRFDDGLRLGE